jgi:RNA polymerase sigma-70 factor (ECF subfamily)
MAKDIDAKILSLFRKDKDKAFSILLDRYHEKIYWHVRSIVISHEDADDVSQECLIKIFRKLDAFKGNSSLYTWIYRIATNEALNLLRKRKRRRTEDMQSHQQEVRQRAAEVFLESSDIEEALIQALDQLPEKQKLVFQLRYFGKQTYEEISRVTNTTIGGLKANYHHAVQKITAILKEKTI